jgi:hypothetical protein
MRNVKYCPALFLLLLLMCVDQSRSQERTAARSAEDLRILQSDASGVTLEFIPAYQTPREIMVGGRPYRRFGFDHSLLPEEVLAGAPDLPIRVALLEFPGESGNTVQVIDGQFADTTGIDVAPIPDATEDEDGPVLRYETSRDLYGVAGFVPATIARLTKIGSTRGTVLGNLVLSPLQYDPAEKKLRKYSRIVVRVAFGPRMASRVSKDRLSSSLAVNPGAFSGPDLSGGRTTAAIRPGTFATGTWFRFSINGSGIYMLAGSSLLAAGISAATDPSTIKIFGDGGDEPDLAPGRPFADSVSENPVFVHDEGNIGTLDQGDYILFYGKGTRDWDYTPGTRSFDHTLNHFSETGVYWVTSGGGPSRKMGTIASLGDPAPFRLQTVQGMVAREDEKVNILSSGLEWVGETFNHGQQITYVHPLPGLVAGATVRYRFNLAARSSASSQFVVSEHGNFVTSMQLSGTSIGSYFSRQMTEAVVSAQSTIPGTDQQSQLRFSFTSLSSSGTGYVDWFEIFYPRMLVAQNDLFEFFTPDTSAVVEYAIGNYSGTNTRVFDVSDIASVSEVTGARLSSDSCVFQLEAVAGSVRKLIVLAPSAFRTPGALVPFPNQDLRGDTSAADYIIITHGDLLPAALRLKSYRERPGTEYLRTKVVDVAQIYNEFGSGFATPVAIRNYLRHEYTNLSPAPRYVLLFGDGDFDYKRILASNPNWIPSWQTFESYYPLRTYSSDDDFVSFNTAGRVEMGCGRLTARSVEEANIFVDKIIQYEAGSVSDPWKIRTTFVADDGLAGPNEDNGKVHTEQAETISGLVPPLFEQRKIYLFEYPTVISSSGRRKPDVNAAIHDAINKGTLILNYTGHGNPRLWAHEQVFVRETDFPYLGNKGKYFFLMAATCNYSAFDALSEQSSGELLAVRPDAGAIAVFSATRAVFSFDNYELNMTFYRNMFQVDSTGRVLPQRLGDIVYRTKQTHTLDNDRKYFLLGDPALSLAFPKRFVSIDSLNGSPSSVTAQLQALGHATLSGSVRGPSGVDSLYSGGTAELSVFDAGRTVRLTDPGAQGFSYRTAGEVLFHGVNSVTSGRVRAGFVVPKDISYTNEFGRMTLYVTNGVTDGAGYTANFRVGGTDSTVVPDTSGPAINMYLDGRSFRPGDVVGANPTLIVDLHDDNGINTSGAGLGHRIEGWIDDRTESIDLTGYYRSSTDTYQEGVVEYQLQGLTEGSHTILIKVWDTHNNSSTARTAFDILAGSGLKIWEVFNYPNPASNGTFFTLRHNQLTPVDVTIKLYTMAGRRLHSLAVANVTDHFIKIPWDLRDADGDPLANGIYLYKVLVKTADGRFSGESYGKVSILK